MTESPADGKVCTNCLRPWLGSSHICIPISRVVPSLSFSLNERFVTALERIADALQPMENDAPGMATREVKNDAPRTLDA